MQLELTVKKISRPYREDPRELVDYILKSLGFERNVDLYRELLLRLITGPETSTKLSEGLTKRTTAIYHIGKLVRAGIVVKRGSRYSLREETFQRTIEEIKRDVDRVFEDLLRVAEELDRILNLPRR